MPTYRITDPSSGRTFRLTGDSPPSEQEIAGIFASMGGPAKPEPAGWRSAADAALRGVGAVGRGIGAVMDVPRSLWSDPLAAGGARAVGLDPRTVDPSTGVQRAARADEMALEAQGLGATAKERTRGRATSQDYQAAAEDEWARGNWGRALGAALGATTGMGLLGDVDRAIRATGGEETLPAKALRLGEDVAARGVGFVDTILTDPASVASVGSIAKVLGAGGKASQAATLADRALAGAGAVAGGAGAVEGGARSIEQGLEGNVREAGLSLLDAALSGGMGYLGARAAREARIPAADVGGAYVHDPRLTAEERAARVAELEGDPNRVRADALVKAVKDQQAEGLTGLLDPERELRAYHAEAPAVDAPVAPEATTRPVEAPKPADLAAEATRDAGARHEAALERAAMEGREAMGALSPEDAAALATIRATSAPPARPRLAPKAEAPVPIPEEPLVSTGKDVRLSPAAARAARLEGATGRLGELEARVEKVLGIARRANDVSGRTGSAANRRSARRAGAVLRSLGLDPATIKGVPEDAAAVREALLKKAPPRAVAQLRAARTGEAGTMPEAQALAARVEAAKAANPPEAPRPAVDQAAAGRGGVSRALGRMLKPVEAALEALPGVGRELAGRVRAFEAQAETMAGRGAAAIERALGALGRSDAERAQAFDASGIREALETGKLDAVPESARPVAQAIRSVMADQAARAVEAGLFPAKQVITDYWPRVPKDMTVAEFSTKVRELAEKQQIPPEEAAARIREQRGSQIIATRAGRRAGAERQRAKGAAGLQEGEYRTDLGVLFEQIAEMERRIAEAQHLGKNGEVAQALVNRLDPEGKSGKFGDRAYAQTVIDRLRGVEPKGASSELSSAVRSVQSATSLVLSPIQQLGSVAQTAAVAGVRPTLKALREVFWNPKVTPEGKGMRAAADRVRKSFQKAKLEAAETGALFTNLNGELADLYGTLAGSAPEASGVAGKAGRLANRTPWLKLAQGVDMAQRIVAAKTAEHFVPRMVAEAQGGSAKAARGLAYMGVDWKGWKGTPEEMAAAAKAISDRTQYRVGMSQLPGWASTPLGKAAFQFQSFGYQHARFMAHLGGEAARGNAAPLARWAAVAYVAGMGVSEARNAIKGVSEEKDADSVAKGLTAALQGRNFDQRDQPLLAAVGNLAATGGMGILQTAGEKLSDLDNPLGLVLGATGSDIGNLVRGATPAVAGVKDIGAGTLAEMAGDRDAAAAAQKSAGENFGRSAKAFARAGASMLPQGIPLGPVPVPLPIAEAVREATSEEKPARAGWAGKARDVAEDAGLLASADPTAAGAAGRERVAELKSLRERTAEIRRQNEAAKTERARATVGERGEKAAKAQLAAEYEAAIIDAVREGDQAKVREIVREARRNRINLTMRRVRTLTGRVTMPDQSEGDEE